MNLVIYVVVFFEFELESDCDSLFPPAMNTGEQRLLHLGLVYAAHQQSILPIHQ